MDEDSEDEAWPLPRNVASKTTHEATGYGQKESSKSKSNILAQSNNESKWAPSGISASQALRERAREKHVPRRADSDVDMLDLREGPPSESNQASYCQSREESLASTSASNTNHSVKPLKLNARQLMQEAARRIRESNTKEEYTRIDSSASPFRRALTAKQRPATPRVLKLPPLAAPGSQQFPSKSSQAIPPPSPSGTRRTAPDAVSISSAGSSSESGSEVGKEGAVGSQKPSKQTVPEAASESHFSSSSSSSSSSRLPPPTAATIASSQHSQMPPPKTTARREKTSNAAMIKKLLKKQGMTKTQDSVAAADQKIKETKEEQSAWKQAMAAFDDQKKSEDASSPAPSRYKQPQAVGSDAGAGGEKTRDDDDDAESSGSEVEREDVAAWIEEEKKKEKEKKDRDLRRKRIAYHEARLREEREKEMRMAGGGGGGVADEGGEGKPKKKKKAGEGKKKAVKRSTKQKVGEEGKVKSNEFVEESEDEGIGGPAGGLEQAAEEFEMDAEMLGNAEADAEDDGLDDLFNEPSGGVAEQEFQEESGMQEDQTEGVGGTEGADLTQQGPSTRTESVNQTVEGVQETTGDSLPLNDPTTQTQQDANDDVQKKADNLQSLLANVTKDSAKQQEDDRLNTRTPPVGSAREIAQRNAARREKALANGPLKKHLSSSSKSSGMDGVGSRPVGRPKSSAFLPTTKSKNQGTSQAQRRPTSGPLPPESELIPPKTSKKKSKKAVDTPRRPAAVLNDSESADFGPLCIDKTPKTPMSVLDEDEDKRIHFWREMGVKWEDIRILFAAHTGKKFTVPSLQYRLKRIRERWPELKEQAERKKDDNNLIGLPALVAANAAENDKDEPEEQQPPRLGGKKWDHNAYEEYMANKQALADYFTDGEGSSNASEDDDDSDDEGEALAPPRKPRTVTRTIVEPEPLDENEVWFQYHVTRKAWTTDEREDNVPTYAVGPPAYNTLREANTAAGKEIQLSRFGVPGISITCSSFSCTTDADGMHHYYVSHEGGIMVRVDVTRSLRAPGAAKPEVTVAGNAWLSKRQWIACAKEVHTVTSTVAVPVVVPSTPPPSNNNNNKDEDEDDDDDDDNDEKNNNENNKDENGGDTAAPDDADFDFLFEEAMNQQELSPPQTSSSPQEQDQEQQQPNLTAESLPTTAAAAPVPTPVATTTATTTTRNIRILGAFTVLDAANREAAAALLEACAPRKNKYHIDVVEQRKQMQREISAKVEELEEEGGAFEATVEVEPSDGGSEEGKTVEVTVWVEEVTLGGPRNV
ncbi:uncharacterized protein LTHEOB_1154 [Lasiodiplodia theobromae]|uniref:uncharacterized protein n=1 Tax=Lasiodiplodia theobromae TaxID=45133 RepID=UPI0015C3F54A|nr:uncharacterized protein LTHEOB_1154 [Lasiodiplodia theobromae]KAF4538800.1 hypothetical protein LTHEOB_1154 [Lasiodiplodia theobromae]